MEWLTSVLCVHLKDYQCNEEENNKVQAMNNKSFI